MVDQPLRFCLVSTFYPPYNFGGDGIYAHRLANGLARLGHEVTVLHSPTAYEMLAGNTPTKGYEDHERVTVKPIPTPLGKLGLLAVQQTGRPWFQGPALRRALERESFDVIHYNNVSLLGGPHAFRMGSGLKLCTLIEHWLVCAMHVLWKFDREVCTKPACLRCVLHGKRPPQVWRYTGLMQRATRHIDAFIGPSLFTMRMHRERGIKGPMIQLPLFHPEPPMPPDTEPANEGRPYFLFVGRLEKIKGVQEIIPTFRKMNGVDLVIAGSGNYEQELRSMAQGADNIRFVGRVDHIGLQHLYRSAIAAIVPSLCYETFGVVVAEAFSARTPVIVYAQSSVEEIVKTHGGGLLYRTTPELEAALERLRTDSVLRERLAGEGRTAYENEFAEESFLQNYMGVVRELLEKKRSGATEMIPSGEPVAAFAGRDVMVKGSSMPQETRAIPCADSPNGGSESVSTLPNRRRVWFFRLLVIGFVTVGAFAAIEAGFRIRRSVHEASLEAKADRGETWAIYDEALGYRMRPKPDHPLGLRSPPIGERSPVVTRILVLGDSIPHGGEGIDDTLVARAQRELNEAAIASELINAGTPGYTTFQSLGFLKKFGVALEPDVVGMCFCVNDLHRILQVFRVRNGKIIGNAFDTGEEAAAKSHGSLYMLARRSLFLRWVRHSVQGVRRRAGMATSSGFSFDQRSDLATAWQDEPWMEFDALMREFVALGHERGFRTFVVAFPYAEQYRKDYLESDRAYVLKPQANLKRICNTLGVPLLDLYDKVNCETDFQADGIHLTSTGRQNVGLQLAAFLREGDLLQ